MKKTRYTLELEKAKKEWNASLWLNFKHSLSEELMDEIGVSEDRDMNVNIVRVCSALMDTSERLDSLEHEHFGY